MSISVGGAPGNSIDAARAFKLVSERRARKESATLLRMDRSADLRQAAWDEPTLRPWSIPGRN